MRDSTPHDFGLLAEHGDSFEFSVNLAAGGKCQLIEVLQTERGPCRTDLAEIPSVTWRKISVRLVRELAEGMGGGGGERAKAAPKLKTGVNRLCPLIGRELAREERCWLYAKAAVPGQRTGIGWRRALFHARSEASDSRAESATVERKSGAGDLPQTFKLPASEPEGGARVILIHRKRRTERGQGGGRQVELVDD